MNKERKRKRKKTKKNSMNQTRSDKQFSLIESDWTLRECFRFVTKSISCNKQPNLGWQRFRILNWLKFKILIYKSVLMTS